MREHWEKEKEAIAAIRNLKEELEQMRSAVERETDLNKVAEIQYGRIPISNVGSPRSPRISTNSRRAIAC